ncbi:hypothetical protein HK104_001475 [Borealophlyctis nickersoniae]|nr:hypothetical protein HK104_001475 [Borealophlyctis nickersoniae]
MCLYPGFSADALTLCGQRNGTDSCCTALLANATKTNPSPATGSPDASSGTSADSGGNGTSKTIIIGGAVAAIVVIGLVAGGIFMMKRRANNQRGEFESGFGHQNSREPTHSPYGDDFKSRSNDMNVNAGDDGFGAKGGNNVNYGGGAQYNNGKYPDVPFVPPPSTPPKHNPMLGGPDQTPDAMSPSSQDATMQSYSHGLQQPQETQWQQQQQQQQQDGHQFDMPSSQSQKSEYEGTQRSQPSLQNTQPPPPMGQFGSSEQQNVQLPPAASMPQTHPPSSPTQDMAGETLTRPTEVEGQGGHVELPALPAINGNEAPPTDMVAPGSSRTDSLGLKTAVYDYVPSLPDEVAVSVGDQIVIMEVFEDGWVFGRNLRSDTCGMLPLCIVEQQPGPPPAPESYRASRTASMYRNSTAGPMPNVNDDA